MHIELVLAEMVQLAAINMIIPLRKWGYCCRHHTEHITCPNAAPHIGLQHQYWVNIKNKFDYIISLVFEGELRVLWSVIINERKSEQNKRGEW